MSRSPFKGGNEIDAEIAVVHSEQIYGGPIDASQVKQHTRRDPVLSRVLQFVLSGWPNNSPDEELRPYWQHRDELTADEGVVLWGLRVVVPSKLRENVLREIHEAHPGSTRCKQLARSYVWWPGIDASIEKFVGSCAECVEHRRDPDQLPASRWEYPTSKWERLHIDYAGPLFGWFWFVWDDAHTKYAGVHLARNEDSKTTIENLRTVFANFGLPAQIERQWACIHK